ncbi:hypothetical protein [Pseudocnuella soli]|uniref:hypothetical protein n=1 Tax=Pseudocnuella soli TaxID=2502779 RepID=UPI0010531F31|nr:hypothetical protein [Pseudocnuella soli]
MNKIVFTLLLLAATTTALAQCDKNVLLSSSKTEYIDASGNVDRTVEENSTVAINKDSIVITPGHDQTMTGTIVSKTCNWTVPFKEGKSVMKVQLKNGTDSEVRNLTITVEGKEGKVTLLAVMDEMPDRQIRVPIDSFVEQQ